ncbi:putative membrane-anchored protein [Weissella uvarum]|uniref:DUF1129 family protein n=1 Tax=Weissella uvarum TaxID=1479233 RepID=UPI001961CABB|nr:DUF1129 family protein [Weissella uvarum]MBM7616876.1 putative membrane-anchored protein [Weissella uvarum]MCM0594672.1 DUF1129 family protein [Weissella uvarum]
MTEEKNETQAAQTAPKLKTHEELAQSGLSKRNQDFMWQVQSLATEEQIAAGLVAEIETELLHAQKSGQTAKQLYGTPNQALGHEVHHNVETGKETVNYAANGFWNIAIDNTFVFFMMFSLMFGIMLMFSSKSLSGSGELGSLGLTALVLTSLSGGVLFAAWTMLMAPNAAGQRMSLVMRIIGSLLIFGTWFLLYMLFGLIPLKFNPILPGWVYLVLAGLAFLGFQWWRRRTGMQGGFMGGTSNNAAKRK